MGRPRDKFAWAQVEELEKGKWKCRHCGAEYTGAAAATRIRNHLSGLGNDISASEKVAKLGFGNADGWKTDPELQALIREDAIGRLQSRSESA